MICKDCIKKDVCKHYAYIKEYSGLELKDCSYRSSSKLSSISYTNNESNIALLSSFSKEDVSERIQKISQVTPSNEDNVLDFKVVSTPTELVECSTCNTKNYLEDLSTCDKCQKQVCPACAFQTYNCTTNELVNLCDDCWNEEEE